MPRWALALTVVVLAGGLIVGYLGLMPRLSDRDQVLAVIADATQAANQRDWSRVLQAVADDYKDPSGYTRADLQRLSLQAGRAFEGYRVQTVLAALVVSDRGRATAMVQLLIYHGEDPAPTRHDVTITFEKRGLRWLFGGRRWLVVSAEGWQDEMRRETGE
jgi:hypothetical protein